MTLSTSSNWGPEELAVYEEWTEKTLGSPELQIILDSLQTRRQSLMEIDPPIPEDFINPPSQVHIKYGARPELKEVRLQPYFVNGSLNRLVISRYVKNAVMLKPDAEQWRITYSEVNLPPAPQIIVPRFTYKPDKLIKYEALRKSVFSIIAGVADELHQPAE